MGKLVPLYKYAYLTYDISMVVKKKRPLERIQEILQEQKGILRTADLVKRGIPRTYLSILEQNGEIERVSRGVYAATRSLTDEMTALQSRFQRAVFSHETAMYLWDLTDRSPLFFSVTVPAGYNASSLKEQGVKVYFIKRELYPLGFATMESLQGNKIRAYDLERTICDIVRSRNQMDVQFVNEALKRYVSKPEINLDLLYRDAKQFGVEKILRDYIEVLL